MSEQAIEQQIQDKGLNAPRITPDHIDSKIKRVYYHSPLSAVDHTQAMDEGTYQHLRCLTFCTIVLENGFTVTGESACASPENFDPFIGKEIALKNAREKIWQLEGYLLKQKLHEANQPAVSDGALEFMKKFVDGHRIVSTGDLTEFQISEARVEGRLYVESTQPHGGIGWVALPWELTTTKDKQREKILAERNA